MLGKQPPAFRDHENGSGFSITKSGTGYTPVHTSGGERNDLTVEDRINELAAALGMPTKDLAAAIAVAVHEYVPPASMSSIAASQTGYEIVLHIEPLLNADVLFAETQSSSSLTPRRRPRPSRPLQP